MATARFQEQSCLRLSMPIPTYGQPQESAVFYCQGFESYFKLSLNEWKPCWFYLEIIIKNEVVKPFELSAFIETPKGPEYFVRELVTNSKSKITSYPEMEVTDMTEQLKWKNLPFVFIFEDCVELMLPSGRDAFRDVFDHKSLAADFAKLRQEPSNYDVLLECQGEEFPAHRDFLCARGKGFEAILGRWNLVGHQTPHKFKIEGVDKEIFREILHYCYTATLHKKLTPEFAKGLYETSLKYDVQALAKKCQNFLVESLTPENVYEILILADAQNDKELKSSVISYILEKKLLLQEPWMLFRERYVNLAFEIYHAFFVSHHRE